VGGGRSILHAVVVGGYLDDVELLVELHVDR
jgi:hypothetical protein